MLFSWSWISVLHKRTFAQFSRPPPPRLHCWLYLFSSTKFTLGPLGPNPSPPSWMIRNEGKECWMWLRLTLKYKKRRILYWTCRSATEKIFFRNEIKLNHFLAVSDLLMQIFEHFWTCLTMMEKDDLLTCWLVPQVKMASQYESEKSENSRTKEV